MKKNNTKLNIYNLPNFISLTRILIAPCLFFLAIKQQANFFLALLIFSEFTDVLDGFLARYLNEITPLGSHLDSWGDFIIYSSATICAWILWPETVDLHIAPIAIIIGSFTVPVIIGFIKFKTLTGYHTWSVKFAVAFTTLSYLLLFSDLLDWMIYLAAIICLYAALEEIAITLILKQEQTDVRSILKALKLRRKFMHHNNEL